MALARRSKKKSCICNQALTANHRNSLFAQHEVLADAPAADIENSGTAKEVSLEMNTIYVCSYRTGCRALAIALFNLPSFAAFFVR